MHSTQKSLLALNIAGGIAVLGSYAWGITMHPGNTDFLWGGVPAGLKPFYNVSMLTAAAGYFPFTLLLLFGIDAQRASVAGRFGFRCFHVLYAMILLPSALWMPLTFQLLGGSDYSLWIAIRVVLALVGIGSLGLLAALLTLSPVASRGWRALAVAGAVAFCVQTALLDATVWPAYFPTDVLSVQPS